jgi:hypothetical protein
MYICTYIQLRVQFLKIYSRYSICFAFIENHLYVSLVVRWYVFDPALKPFSEIFLCLRARISGSGHRRQRLRFSCEDKGRLSYLFICFGLATQRPSSLRDM